MVRRRGTSRGARGGFDTARRAGGSAWRRRRPTLRASRRRLPAGPPSAATESQASAQYPDHRSGSRGPLRTAGLDPTGAVDRVVPRGPPPSDIVDEGCVVVAGALDVDDGSDGAVDAKLRDRTVPHQRRAGDDVGDRENPDRRGADGVGQMQRSALVGDTDRRRRERPGEPAEVTARRSHGGT